MLVCVGPTLWGILPTRTRPVGGILSDMRGQGIPEKQQWPDVLVGSPGEGCTRRVAPGHSLESDMLVTYMNCSSDQICWLDHSASWTRAQGVCLPRVSRQVISSHRPSRHCAREVGVA